MMQRMDFGLYDLIRIDMKDFASEDYREDGYLFAGMCCAPRNLRSNPIELADHQPLFSLS